MTLKFEQVLYDGGLTPNQVEQYKEAYNNIQYKSNDTVEDIIAKIVTSYLDLLLNDSLIVIDDLKLESHDRYLELAKSQEKVTGEILDRLQIESKITAIMDNYLDQLVQKQKSLSTFKKLSGKKIMGNICKPNIDEKLIPSTIEEAIDKALRNNNTIRAQKATIKEQEAVIRKVEAKFRPDLKLQVQGDLDNDLRLAENGRQDIYRIRLQSDWNLYDGGKNTIELQREKISLLKEYKKLDSIRNNIIDEIKGRYNTYFERKKRIDNLNKFVSLNAQIVDVYKSQIKDGSRTFVDLLDAEAELFRTRILLVTETFNMYKEYFKILRSTNKLSDTILEQSNQTCKAFDIKTILPNYKKEVAPAVQNIDDQAKSLGLEG